MKKLLSVLLVLVMMLSLTFVFSCDKDNGDGENKEPTNPKTDVAQAITKTNALDEYKATMEMNMDMTMTILGTEMKMEVPMTSDITVKNAHGEKPEIYTETEMTVMGTTTKTQTYCDGNWQYTYDGEEGYKEAAEEIGDYVESLEDAIKNIPNDLLEGLSFEKVENGYKVTVQIPDDQFADIYDEIIDSATESLGEDMDVTISNAVVDVIINNGYIVEYDIEFDMVMEMDMSGMTAQANAHVVANTTIHNPGQAVTITPMEGYQDYPEL